MHPVHLTRKLAHTPTIRDHQGPQKLEKGEAHGWSAVPALLYFDSWEVPLEQTSSLYSLSEGPQNALSPSTLIRR